MSAALAPQVLVGAAPAGVTLSAGSNEESDCVGVLLSKPCFSLRSLVIGECGAAWDWSCYSPMGS